MKWAFRKDTARFVDADRSGHRNAQSVRVSSRLTALCDGHAVH